MAELNVTLASLLLDLEHEAGSHEARFATGVSELDDRIQVWNGGRILGVGKVESTSRKTGRKHENSTTEAQNLLLLDLLTTHLLNVGQQKATFSHPDWSLSLQGPSKDSTEQQLQHPSVFIIAPPKSTTISDTYNTLLQAIQTSQSTYQRTHPQNEKTQMVKAEEIALQILEQVNLLQYLDLTGLAESISETNSILSSSSTASVSSTSSSAKKSPKQKIILVEGINSTISRALNRSSPSSVLVRTAALVTGIFKSLRNLVQSNTEVLVLVELEVGVELARTDVRFRERGEGLKSVFVDGMGRSLRIGASTTSGGGAARRVISGNYAAGGAVGGGSAGAVVVLERILGNALDGIVVVHDGFKDADDGSSEGGKMIVEVMKDAMGDELGSWAVWPGT